MRAEGPEVSKARSRRPARLGAAAAAGIGWAALSAFAQPPAPSQPPPAPTRDDIRAPVRPPAAAERPRLQVEGGLERPPCALDAPEYQAIRFTPTAVTFENLEGLAPADLRPAYTAYLGAEQPLSVICRIRDDAAAILREAGYIAAVEVPEQRIEGGQIRLRVLMAKLVALRVRGNAGANERLIASYLQHLADQPVFNRHEAERYLLLAGDLPGYNVRLALRPAGTVPGAVIGEVTVARLPGQLDLNLQNFGSRAVGREGALLRGQLFGLTGMGDRTSLAFYTTADLDEQQTLQAAHEFRLGDEGLRISAQGTYAWAKPDTGEPLIDIRSRTLFASVEADYPLVRTQRFSLYGGAGFDWSDQDVEFNTLPLSRDHLRTVFARVEAAAAAPVSAAERSARLGPAWRVTGDLEVRQGLDIFGASKACGAAFAACLAPGVIPPSRLEGRPDATILRASLASEWRPFPGVSLFVGALGQYAFDPLLGFEEFSAGNYTVGRGYDPATLVGDRGLGVQAEVRFGRLDPQSPKDLAVQPYLFLDSAWVGNEDSLVVTGGKEHLQSVGAGVRAVLGDRFQLDAVFAVPLTPAGLFAQTPDPRFLISLTTRLWPWRTR